jgi:hypothetical protein
LKNKGSALYDSSPLGDTLRSGRIVYFNKNLKNLKALAVWDIPRITMKTIAMYTSGVILKFFKNIFKIIRILFLSIVPLCSHTSVNFSSSFSTLSTEPLETRALLFLTILEIHIDREIRGMY